MQIDYSIDELLTQLAEWEASDLHLTAGVHPTVRVHGELKPLTEFPVLILTGGRVEAADEAYSFEIGAVDYVRKGGDTAVLVSRIGAAIRRHRPSSSYLRRGRLLVDTVDDRAWLGGRELHLEHRPLQAPQGDKDRPA